MDEMTMGRKRTRLRQAFRKKRSGPLKSGSSHLIDVSALIAALAFGFGVYQYQSSEGWQRAQFVTTQLKDFESDRINEDVLRMMDYDPAKIELYPEKEKDKEADQAYADVPFATFTKSISEDIGFSDTEYRVKQYFEHFLTSLSRFDYFVNAGAITPEELCADFGYPVALMTDVASVRQMKRKFSDTDVEPFAVAVNAYLNRWNYVDVKDFLARIDRACNQ